MQNRTCVLNKEAISRRLKRMALEIAEQNNEEKELIIAGIAGNGEVVAQALIENLKQIAGFHISYVRILLNKKEPREVTLEPAVEINHKTVILVDDVANTGRTMLYALKPFLEAQPAKIQTLALVERSHKRFPIKTDYAGMSLATTMQEHISVETEDGAITGAWLY